MPVTAAARVAYQDALHGIDDALTDRSDSRSL
jgi:hypothetical protein